MFRQICIDRLVQPTVVAQVHLLIADKPQRLDLNRPRLREFGNGGQDSAPSDHEATRSPCVHTHYGWRRGVARMHAVIQRLRRHQRLNGVNRDRYVACNQFATAVGDDRIVLNANADVMKRGGDIGLWPDVKTGFDRQHHSGLQDSALCRLSGGYWFAVSAAIVDIHPKPMAGPVHVKRAVRLVGDHIICSADFVFVQDAEVEQALRQNSECGLMRIVEARAGAGRRNGGILAGQDQGIHVALRPAETPIGRESAGDV